MSKFDVVSVRRNFPFLQKKRDGHIPIYFDSAATTHKPQCVIDTVQHFYQEQYATVHRAVYSAAATASSLYDATRVKMQQLLHAAKREEIIFTKGTTESINLVAHCFADAFLQNGDEIILSEIEHHANMVPWQHVCKRKNARIKYIPVNDCGELDIEAYKKLLSSHTRLVSIAHVSNSLGTIHPIEQIIELAHSFGAKVLIDGAQSVAHMPIDVQELDCDFFVCSSHKMFGPTGLGILYGKADLLNAMPPYQFGGDMIDQVTLQGATYQALPLKFEAGTPSIAAVIGLGAAIDYLNHLGLENIAKAEHKLLLYATEQLNKIADVHIVGTAANKGPIISFVVSGLHHLDIGTMLDLRGIAVRTGHHCSQPTMCRFDITGTVRLSFAFYNTKEEIDQFVFALQEVINLLRG